jgi:hypothetical protein
MASMSKSTSRASRYHYGTEADRGWRPGIIGDERLKSDTRTQDENMTQDPIERCLHPVCTAALISLPLEPLQARAHHVFEKHVVEVRCPAGISVMHKEQAMTLAQNIIAACLPNTNQPHQATASEGRPQA